MLYTFYGDDFTGSTDVLEQLASNGVPSVLFLAEPTPQQRERFSDVEAIGIAGESRSRSPQWMTENLPRIFTTLKSFRAPVNHYKVCSTFDSSPTHGSIGRAIELGREVFDPMFVPIVVAAPHLGRYVVKGELFAVAPDGRIKRIDQHPMANHPVTPMREPDLRRHLAAQTSMPINLVTHHTEAELSLQLQAGAQVILFDGADEQAPAAIGELLWQRAQRSSLFAVGSSGLTAALIPAWRNAPFIASRQPAPSQSRHSGPLLVVSGSCSPVTAGQIQWALANGFHGIAVDPARLSGSVAELERIRTATSDCLNAGKDVIVYTALGPTDTLAHGDALGRALGRILRHLIETTNTHRAVVCGGDTASHAIQQLGLYALTWAAPVQIGAPLCRAHSDHPVLQGMELVLKGGQVGTPDFFHLAHRA